jgi:hypothetical protein
MRVNEYIIIMIYRFSLHEEIHFFTRGRYIRISKKQIRVFKFMKSYAVHAMSLFNPSLTITPPIVHVFTLLRHGDYSVNELGYPELSCETHLSDAKMAGDAASKLTAALSIHMESFLGLSCSDVKKTSQDVTYVARFAGHLHATEVRSELELKAADIIDTLMALA